MAKQIVFCADGTWNGPGDASPSDIDGNAQSERPGTQLDAKQLGQPFHTPWKKPPFDIGAHARTPAAGDGFHPSVSRRWQANAAYKKLWPNGF